jgi:hypothetical protein
MALQYFAKLSKIWASSSGGSNSIGGDEFDGAGDKAE